MTHNTSLGRSYFFLGLTYRVKLCTGKTHSRKKYYSSRILPKSFSTSSFLPRPISVPFLFRTSGISQSSWLDYPVPCMQDQYQLALKYLLVLPFCIFHICRQVIRKCGCGHGKYKTCFGRNAALLQNKC